MIDNTHVVVLSGTGQDMVPVPEMAAFAQRFGGVFAAHEKGDANRSARVERPFDYIDNNFLAGREFDDWAHVNREARAWCDKVNATTKRHLRASPRELFAIERARLSPLPAHVPEVYRLHERIVDSEGYVNVNTNRYSAPWRLIDATLLFAVQILLATPGAAPAARGGRAPSASRPPRGPLSARRDPRAAPRHRDLPRRPPRRGRGAPAGPCGRLRRHPLLIESAALPRAGSAPQSRCS